MTNPTHEFLFQKERWITHTLPDTTNAAGCRVLSYASFLSVIEAAFGNLAQLGNMRSHYNIYELDQLRQIESNGWRFQNDEGHDRDVLAELGVTEDDNGSDSLDLGQDLHFVSYSPREAASPIPDSEAESLENCSAEEQSRSKTNICWSFRDTGSCRFGKNCRFRHIEQLQVQESQPASPTRKKREGICWSYRDTGHCKFGSRCHFQHVDSPEGSSPNVQKVARRIKGYCMKCLKNQSCPRTNQSLSHLSIDLFSYIRLTDPAEQALLEQQIRRKRSSY